MKTSRQNTLGSQNTLERKTLTMIEHIKAFIQEKDPLREFASWVLTSLLFYDFGSHSL